MPSFPLDGFTSRWYGDFFNNPALIDSIKTSATVATVASSISLALGTLSSIVLVRRRFFGKSAVAALLLTPLVMPYIAFGIALLILFRELGVELGLLTIVAGHVVITLPYTILVLVPRLERIDRGLEEAARDLGAGPLRTFSAITLPLILPAIVSAFLIGFTVSFDEYAVASFTAGNEVTFPIYLFSQLRFPRLLPQVIAVAVVVLAVSLVVVLAAEVGRRTVERRLDVA